MKHGAFISTIPALLALLCWLPCGADAAVVFSQPHDGSASLYQSSVNGTDYDQLTWDLFRVTNSTAITEVRWRGGYIWGGQFSGMVTNWTIAIYRDVGGFQPDIIGAPFASYTIGGDANQTPAGAAGATALYDYSAALPSAFQAVAGSNYWLLIQANEPSIPDWGIALGTGSHGKCFRRTAGVGDWRYYVASGDTAFSLVCADGPTAAIAANASPAEGGEVLGGGSYPAGSTATVTANPATGYGFVNWTENGNPVNNSPVYSFTASSARSLVAHFVPSYVITASATPGNGGTVSGAGVYNSNAPVTVTATEAAGYAFVNWTEYGTEVSTSASYDFPAAANRTLVAHFKAVALTATFDFDTGSPPVQPMQGMPGSQTQNGVTAYFSTLSGGWSVQRTFSGWVPGVFSGNFLYPSTWGSTMAIAFSKPMTNFSMAFFTGDVSSEYDVPTTVQVSAYTNSAMTSPVAAATAKGDWLTGAYPEGTMSFGSAIPFTKVVIDMPPRQTPTPSYLFFVDNISVQGPAPASVTIAASSSPANAAAISGDGVFEAGASVTVTATPNNGYAFSSWTENGGPVSASPSYTFTATTNRTLVADCVQVPPSYPVVTEASPSNGGTTAGDGIYTNGEAVVVSSFPAPGYDFVNWTENGSVVSASPDYSFNAAGSRLLIANFAAAVAPRLSIAPAKPWILLSWPASSPGFALEMNPDLTASNWQAVTNEVNLVGTNQEVLFSPGSSNRFFRLVHP